MNVHVSPLEQHDVSIGLARTIHYRYIWYFWQGNHHTYGHIWCVYTVLANHVLAAYGVGLVPCQLAWHTAPLSSNTLHASDHQHASSSDCVYLHAHTPARSPVFRGFLLTSLTRWMPPWAALTLSSLAFGLCHLSLRDLPVLTALGMLLGSTYVRRSGRKVYLCCSGLLLFSHRL